MHPYLSPLLPDQPSQHGTICQPPKFPSLPPQASDSSGSAATVPRRQPSTTLSTQSVLPTTLCPILAPDASPQLPLSHKAQPRSFTCLLPSVPSTAPSAQCATTTSIAFRPRSRKPSFKIFSTRSLRAREALPCRHTEPRLSPDPPLQGRTPAAATLAPQPLTALDALLPVSPSLVDVDIMETQRTTPLIAYLTAPEPPLSATDAAH